MNVGELIEVLKNAPTNAKIVLSSDAEGNSFGTLEEVSLGVRVEKDFQGFEDELMVFPGDDDEDENQILEDAIVLWP